MKKMRLGEEEPREQDLLNAKNVKFYYNFKYNKYNHQFSVQVHQYTRAHVWMYLNMSQATFCIYNNIHCLCSYILRKYMIVCAIIPVLNGWVDIYYIQITYSALLTSPSEDIVSGWNKTNVFFAGLSYARVSLSELLRLNILCELCVRASLAFSAYSG